MGPQVDGARCINFVRSWCEVGVKLDCKWKIVPSVKITSGRTDIEDGWVLRRMVLGV